MLSQRQPNLCDFDRSPDYNLFNGSSLSQSECNLFGKIFAGSHDWLPSQKLYQKVIFSRFSRSFVSAELTGSKSEYALASADVGATSDEHSMAPCGEQFLFIEIELRRQMPTAGTVMAYSPPMSASFGAALSNGSRRKEGAGTIGFLPEQ